MSRNKNKRKIKCKYIYSPILQFLIKFDFLKIDYCTGMYIVYKASNKCYVVLEFCLFFFFTKSQALKKFPCMYINHI